MLRWKLQDGAGWLSYFSRRVVIAINNNMLKADMAISNHHPWRIDFFLDFDDWCCWIGNPASAEWRCNKGGLSPYSSLRSSCDCILLSRFIVYSRVRKSSLLEYPSCSDFWIKAGVEVDIIGEESSNS
jgi:hypothetical protein